VSAATTRLFDAGAVSRLDVMQSQNQLLQQRQREITAEAAMHDAEIVYKMTTGLATRPQSLPTEALSALTEISSGHPVLQYLQSDVAVAAGQLRQTEISAKGSPQMTVGTRREQGNSASPVIDTITLSVQVPFGGKNIVSARTSGARLAQTDAEVAWRAAERQLQLALHEAEHELDVTRQALPLAQEQAAIDAERSVLAQRAFDAGELTLPQVLAAVQEARNSARTLTQLQHREQRLIAEYNQAVGVLP
jgi:cobalt-zinc-cadmium efflux system outer membrane protein